jgi:hypothetical protein
MSRQRSAVQAPSGSAPARCSGLGIVGIGFSAGCDLLDLFQGEQELVFRQRLGSPAEAMPLQFFDDLLEPLGTRALRQQPRFERAGIVWKRIRRGRHGGE